MAAYPEKWKEKFYARIAPKDEKGCMLWTGNTSKGGYGEAWRLGGRYAHRHSWALVNGPIPTGKQIRHLCGNPLCQNPEHLAVGTQRENAQDARDLGEYPVGSERNANIQEEDVRLKRIAFFRKNVDLRACADAWQCSISMASDILNGRLWRHVAMPEGMRHKPPRIKRKRDRRKRRPRDLR